VPENIAASFAVVKVMLAALIRQQPTVLLLTAACGLVLTATTAYDMGHCRSSLGSHVVAQQ
jgi:hypothetical protein